MVQCADDTFYVGWTNNLKQRLQAHNAGSGAKYTRSRRPVKLVYFKEFVTKEEAMKEEYRMKQLTHQEKEALIQKEGI